MLNHKRFFKRALAVASTMALAFGLIPLSYSMAEPEPMEYVNEFSSLESLNDFQILYQADPNVAPAILEEEASVHWTWDAEAGMVRRKEALAPGVSTAILTLKDYTFKNFEATIKYRDGTANWGWVVLCFRHNAPGTYFSQDGMGAYIDVAGQAWGSGEGGWYLGSTERVPGYVQGQDMTMTVRVVGQKFQLFYGEDTTAAPYIEHDLNEYAADDGYLSIMSAGNDSAIDYLRVKRLDDAGNVIPLTQKVTGVDPLQTRVVATGTEKSAAIGQLPKTVQAVDALGVRKTCGVTWESADYNGDAAGTYTFTGTLQPGKASPNPDDVKATVQVEVSDTAEPLDQVETWYFDTMDVFEDFTPYWFANTADAALVSVKEHPDTHWTVANGYAQRKRHFAALANSSILTLGTQLKDFEATLTYVDDSISWGWTVMGYREAAPGKHFQYSGAGAYFDTAGQAFFRAPLAEGGITDYGAAGEKIPDYVKGQEMTVTVRVIGDKMDLFYGADTSGEPFYTQTKEDLPESGYFSLEAVGGDSILKKLTIKRYDVAQSVAAVTPIGVENGTSLEGALALLPGTVDVTDDNGDTHACVVTWSCADYDGSTEGSYTFSGSLTMPNKYLSNPQNLQAQVQVAVPHGRAS